MLKITYWLQPTSSAKETNRHVVSAGGRSNAPFISASKTEHSKNKLEESRVRPKTFKLQDYIDTQTHRN